MKPRLQIPRPASRAAYICRTCLSSTRPPLSHPATRFYSTPTTPPPSAGYTHLPSRRLLSITGPDSTHFLHGLITTSLTSRTTGFYAAFLNGVGRLLHDVFIYPYKSDEAWNGKKGGEGYLVEVDAKEVDVLAKHVKRYKLRSKLEIRVLDVGEREVWSAWEGEGGWTRHGLGADDAEPSGVGEGVIVCEDKRAPGMGRRLLVPGGQKLDIDAEETTEDVYRLRRYLKGVAEGQDEMPREHALPQESNVDFMGGIDYKKGCYVGQELTIRTHHRGVVRKRILPVMLYGVDEPIPASLEYIPGKEVGVEGLPNGTSIGRWEKRGRSAGKFMTGVGNVGLGLCRLETMTDVQVQGEAGGYKEGDEFKLEWEVEGEEGKTVKVKAFVPPWHLTKQ